MSKRSLFVSALLVTLAALLIFQVQHARSQQRQQRRAQWQAYLHGPLSDYLYAASRGRELLALKKLQAPQREALGEAVGAMRRSWNAVVRVKPQWEEDPFFADLVKAAAWHAEAAHLAEDWPRLDLRDRTLMENASGAAQGISRNLAMRLEAQRLKVLAELEPGQDELLEMNAMIYALKEAATGAKKL